MAAELNRSAKHGSQAFDVPAPTTAPDPYEHLAALVDCSDEPIISKRLDGTIISWNPAATRVFGYQPSEIIGKSILTLIPPELEHEETEILRKLRAGERVGHFETTRMRKNGERFPISVTISPIRDAPAGSWPPPRSRMTFPSAAEMKRACRAWPRLSTPQTMRSSARA